MARDLVLQVAVTRTRHRSRWYSIPLTVIATAGGGAAGYRISNLMTCDKNSSPCKEGKGSLIALFAIGAGGLTYALTNKQSEALEVIYFKTPVKTNPTE